MMSNLLTVSFISVLTGLYYFFNSKTMTPFILVTVFGKEGAEKEADEQLHKEIRQGV